MLRNGHLAVALAVLALLAGCSGSTSGEPENGTIAEESPTATQEEIEIVETEWQVVRTYESDAVNDDYALVGTARNDADQPMDVFIECRFYDADDVQIGDFTASASGVQPGDQFRFEVPYTGEDPSRVERWECGWEAYPA